jgi:RND family efflux transporter MFP subunit
MARQLLLAALPLSLGLVLVGCTATVPPPPSPPPPLVQVSAPVTEEVTDYEEFTGKTEALKFVQVKARVTGYLDEILFKDGAEVKKNQVLFQIDPRPLKATMAQTDATLRQSEAHLKRLNRDFTRATDLQLRKAISQQDYDQIAGDRDEAEAAVGVARANRNLARINLDFARVTAPISGRISRRMVDPGNLVKADDMVLTTIAYLDSLYVYFDIDERTFLHIQKLVKEKKMPSLGDHGAVVDLGLADEKGYSLQGTVDFEDNSLDPATGTFRVRAVVDNRDRLLSPGLFVRVRLPLGRPHRALLVAEQALGTDQGKKFVWIVGADKKVQKRRFVTVGRVHHGLREILGGLDLKPGEQVIVRGLQRVRPETVVNLKDVPMPRASLKSEIRNPKQAQRSNP